MSDIKENNKIRVTFCAYRDWALNAVHNLKTKCNIEIIDIIQNNDEYNDKVLQYTDNYVDCIVLIGWSWIIRDDTLKRFFCVGMHPSDLPFYRGGSPIQHQIIDGIEHTQISLMTISADGIDIGDIWCKEEWDLRGQTMYEILKNLTVSTERLLQSFFYSFRTIVPLKQDISKGTFYKRRKPDESKVTWQQLSGMHLKDVYNLIRALGDPYPNIFIEDQDGNKLFFKEVQYVASDRELFS